LDAIKPPGRDDWGEIDHNDLDADWAFQQFFGKSFEQAVEMFRSNAPYYQEDLPSMPAKAFNFYAPALVKYITSGDARGDSDGASSFLYLVIEMFETRREIVAPETGRLLADAAEYVAGRQEFYDAGVDMYGSFPDLHARIQRLHRA
jgi:hypothetical protein